MTIELKFKGTTPKQLLNRIRRIPHDIQRNLIEAPAKAIARKGQRTVSSEMREKLNLSDRFLRENITGTVIRRGNRSVTARIRIKSRMAPIRMFRPHYFAGAEAQRGNTYGRGTAYTIYKGQRQLAGNVFQRPSVANPNISPTAGFRYGANDYLTRGSSDDEKWPVRPWRGINVANYYRNDVGRRELPHLRSEMTRLVRQEMRARSARVFGRGRRA